MLLSETPYVTDNGGIYFTLFAEDVPPQIFLYDTVNARADLVANLTEFCDGTDTSMIYVPEANVFAYITPSTVDDGDALFVFTSEGVLLHNSTLFGLKGLGFGVIGTSFYGLIADAWRGKFIMKDRADDLDSFMVLYNEDFIATTFQLFPSVPLLSTTDADSNLFVIW